MNKDCVINPKTGRAVKIGSVAGKRVMKTDPTPTHDCVVNPKTGRAVKKTGAVGKKIVNASSTITQAVKMKIARKTVEKAKAEAKPKTPPPAPPALKPNPMGGMAKGGRKKKEPPKNNLPELPRDVWKKVLKEVYKDGWDFDEGWNKLSMKFILRRHYMDFPLSDRKLIKEEDETGVYHRYLDNMGNIEKDMTGLIKLVLGLKRRNIIYENLYENPNEKSNLYLENWLKKYQPECILNYNEYKEHADRWGKVKFHKKFNLRRAKVYYEWIKYDPKNNIFKSAKYADIENNWTKLIKYHYDDDVNVDDYKRYTDLYLIRLTDANGKSIPEAITNYFLFSKEEKAFLDLRNDSRHHNFVDMMFNYRKKGNGEMRVGKRTETKRWYNQHQDYDIIKSPIELELFKPKKVAK